MKLRLQKIRKFVPMFAAMALLGAGGQAMAGEEFRTNRGKVYRDCELLSRDDYGIMIRHREGAARLAYSDLSREVQQRFKYDRNAAKKFVQHHAPVRSSRNVHRRAMATHFTGFSPQLAATRAHLAFAGGLLGAPFCGSLGVPGVRSFNAWQTDPHFAKQNPYHSSHSAKVKNGYVVLNNRRRCDRFDVARHYQHAYQRGYNPHSYLQNRGRYGNPIAPAMNGNHIRASNAGNPVAPAMMSYSQFQAARARAISKSAPVRHVPRGGGRGK